MITSEWTGTERLVELARQCRKLSLASEPGIVAKYDQVAQGWRDLFRTNGIETDECTAQTALLTLQTLFDQIEHARGDSLMDVEADVFESKIASMATALCAAFDIR